MLKHSKGIANFVFNSKLLCLFLVVFFSSITISLSATECTEQWSEIELDQKDWIYTGDANITISDEEGPTFRFGNQDATNIVGAVWHKYDFSQKKGLLISFKPTIHIDTSYYGNLKYPHGFAIVFTSSSIENLIGEKASGIGYEGIMNAIAFEFDFVKNSANGDEKYPHLSVHYNINGQISASSKDYDDKYKKNCTNQPIPNFYDNSLDLYYKNIIFEIQIVGKKLIVRSNRNSNPIVQYDFTPFQQLLEQEGVHIGITSSMNKEKQVTITDFKVSQVSTKDKGILQLKSSTTTYKAGEEITLSYSIQSTCGKDLKIYLTDENQANFVLKINNEKVKPNSISFNDQTSKVEIVITENLQGTYTAVVEFQGHVSSPAIFTVNANDVVSYEICGNTNKENPNNITLDLERNKDYFMVPLCSYDQFNNQKKISLKTSGIKIKYPNNIIADKILETELSTDKKKLIVKVPISNFGLYEIFNENFMEEKIRYYELMPKHISPEKSDVSILYGANLVQDTDKEISLRIKVRDEYGRDIPNIILEKLNCDFTKSSVTGNSKITVSYKDDAVLLTIAKPSSKIKYTFIPKVKCDGIEQTEFSCGYDSETKINNCEFYYQSPLAENKIRVYSDYLEIYNTYEKESDGTNPLIISLDEIDNKKLTEVYLIDSEDSIYFSTSEKTVSAKLNGDDLEVKNIGNKYVILLPQGKTRGDYTPINVHTLSITVGSSNFNINTYFYYLDHFMSNVNTVSDTTDITYIGFYKQVSLTLKAAETLMLFDIYELRKTFLGKGDHLDESKVSLLINSKASTNTDIVKYSTFISVISHDFTKAGTYAIELKYDTSTLSTFNLIIEARNEAYYLGDFTGEKLKSESIEINKEELLKLTLLDKYENILKNNQVFNSFAKTKILNQDIFTIKPNYDGKIYILNEGQSLSSSTVTLKLDTGTEYTIKSKYIPSFNDIDTLNSFGILDSSLTPILTKTTLKIYLNLRDAYGNTISKSELDNETIDKLNVYVEGENLKEVVPLLTEGKYFSSGYQYFAEIGKLGDFEVKIFYDDLPIECKGCHFRVNSEGTTVDTSKSVIHLLGNKMRIPIRKNEDNNKIKAALVDKNSNNFVFYYEQRDQYLNEVKDTRSISFTFASASGNTYANEVEFYSYGSSEDEKGFFKLYSEGLEKFQKLSEGLYSITKTIDNIVLYLVNKFIY